MGFMGALRGILFPDLLVSYLLVWGNMGLTVAPESALSLTMRWIVGIDSDKPGNDSVGEEGEGRETATSRIPGITHI